MNYKYSLEKSSKKHICPSCNKKKYVRFINNETNEYLDYNYGRCDRETSCGYFKKPAKNLVSSVSVFQKPISRTPSFINSTIVYKSLQQYHHNNLYLYLIKYFDKNEILKSFTKYKVGTSKKWIGSTVFWQMDDKAKFRTGKIMLYNKMDGKRVKKPYNHISWVHRALNITDFNLKQCLFGLHLVNKTTKVIGIVESEKTALTMDLFLPTCTWLATGSKQNLKEEFLNPIKKYSIILYPDKSEFKDWNYKCEELLKKGFKIRCSDLVEKSALKVGSDLADIYFDLENKNLENIPLTETETKVQKLNSVNPNIKNLIEIFDLTDNVGNEIRIDLL